MLLEMLFSFEHRLVGNPRTFPTVIYYIATGSTYIYPGNLFIAMDVDSAS